MTQVTEQMQPNPSLALKKKALNVWSTGTSTLQTGLSWI